MDDSIILEHLLKKLNTTRAEVQREMRESFTDYIINNDHTKDLSQEVIDFFPEYRRDIEDDSNHLIKHKIKGSY